MIVDDCSRFMQEYLGSWDIDERTAKLRAIAEQYHAACDQYDNMVCSGSFRGKSLPANNIEFSLVNIHAKKVLRLLADQNTGFTMREIMRAIQQHRK